MIDLRPKTNFLIGIKGPDTRYLNEENISCVCVDYWSLKWAAYYYSY